MPIAIFPDTAPADRRAANPSSAGFLSLRWSGVVAALFLVWAGISSGAPALPEGENIFVDQPESTESQGNDILNPLWGVGSWIWAPETHDKQTCRMWRAFEIPKDSTVARAKIHIGVDNGYRLMLDGRELGTGSDWRSITEYDISLLLRPGRHALAVEAFNDNREAGMLFGLIIELTDGRVIKVPSDTRWRIAPKGLRSWEKRLDPSPDWKSTVIVSEFLPREGTWHKRMPTMTVKVPVLQPLEEHFWKTGWFQAGLWSVLCVTGLLYLRLLAKHTLQSRAEAMLQTERARIARDIHDELGARLTELALEGEVAQTELPTDSTVRPRLEALCEKARAVSTAMDEVVWMVNSRRDTLRDFANFACKHAQRFLSQTAIRCRLDVDGGLPDAPFPLPLRRNLLLGVKEALNNSVKYSNATEIRLSILLRGQTLVVAIEDNGGGFDLAATDTSRNGLTNMAERMKEVGGECKINSTPGSGCRVEFRIPLPKSHRHAPAENSNTDPALASIRSIPSPSPAPAANPKAVSP